MEDELNDMEIEILEELTSSDKFIDDMCQLNTRFDKIKEQFEECTEKFERIEKIVQLKEAETRRSRRLRKFIIVSLVIAIIIQVSWCRELVTSFYTTLVYDCFWSTLNYAHIAWGYICDVFQYDTNDGSEDDYIIEAFQAST